MPSSEDEQFEQFDPFNPVSREIVVDTLTRVISSLEAGHVEWSVGFLKMLCTWLAEDEALEERAELAEEVSEHAANH